MTPERCIQLAEQCGFPPEMVLDVFATEIQEFARAVRREALEEAMKTTVGVPEIHTKWPKHVDIAGEAITAAIDNYRAAIRALITKGDAT